MLTAAGVTLFDGILYPSRNNYPSTSIALVDRAAAKVQVVDEFDLNEHRDWPEFVSDFAIGIIDDRS